MLKCVHSHLEGHRASNLYFAKSSGNCNTASEVATSSSIITSGGGGVTLDKLSTSTTYLSVFTEHFLNHPAENCRILRKLYLNFGLSMQKIAKLTNSAWAKSTILKALKANGISKGKRPK